MASALNVKGVLENKHFIGKEHCPAAVDHKTGSSMYWAPLSVNSSTQQSCPEGATGNVTRHCAEVRGEAVWEDPDVTGCYNNQLQSHFSAGWSLIQSFAPKADDVAAFLAQLTRHLDQAAWNHSLYPTDLEQSSDYLKGTASTIDAMSGKLHDFDDLCQSFGDVLSSMLDNGTLDTWYNFDEQTSVSQYAIDILETVSVMALNMIHHPNSANNLSSVAKNLNFDIKVTDTFEEDFANFTSEHGGYVMKSADESTTFIFTEDVLNITIHSKARWDRPIKGFFRGEYETLSRLLHVDSTRNDELMTMIDSTNSTTTMSKIVTAEVMNMDPSYYRNLSIPVVIIFQHFYEDIDEARAIGCVFLNESATSARYLWSTEGCNVADVNETHVTCHCNHLTNFALIMDFYKMNISAVHDRVLSYISYLGGSLSVICCLTSIVVYQILRLKSERIRVHEMLALSIILTQLIFFVGFDRVKYKALCKTMAVLLHYSLTAMFCWMLVEGIHLYMSLIKVFRKRSHFGKYLIIGWGIPAINVLISVAVFMDEYASEEYCWLSTKLLLTGFLPFVIITVVTNSVILVMVLRVMIKSLKTRDEDYIAAKVGVKAIVILLPLLGLTWVFGVLSVGTTATLVFTYMFTICNSLQGLFFFLFHCVMNADVKNAFQRKYMHKKHHGQQQASNFKEGGGVSTLSNYVVEGDSVRRVVQSQKRSASSLSVLSSSESSGTNQTNVDGSASDCGSRDEFIPPDEQKASDCSSKSAKDLYNVVKKRNSKSGVAESCDTDSEKYDSLKTERQAGKRKYVTKGKQPQRKVSAQNNRGKTKRPGTPPAIKKNCIDPKVFGEKHVDYMEWVKAHELEDVIVVEKSNPEAGEFVIHI